MVSVLCQSSASRASIPIPIRPKMTMEGILFVDAPGTLIHPTVGAIQAALTRFDWYERDGVMGIVDIEMELVESVNWLGSTITLALDAAIGLAAATFGRASADGYIAGIFSSDGLELWLSQYLAQMLPLRSVDMFEGS